MTGTEYYIDEQGRWIYGVPEGTSYNPVPGVSKDTSFQSSKETKVITINNQGTLITYPEREDYKEIVYPKQGFPYFVDGEERIASWGVNIDQLMERIVNYPYSLNIGMAMFFGGSTYYLMKHPDLIRELFESTGYAIAGVRNSAEEITKTLIEQIPGG